MRYYELYISTSYFPFSDFYLTVGLSGMEVGKMEEGWSRSDTGSTMMMMMVMMMMGR